MTNLSTFNALKELIQASLADLRDRPHAVELLSKLVSDLRTLPPALRWASVEFLLQSAATLRDLNDERRASRLRLEITKLFIDDSDLRRDIDLPALFSIASRLREHGRQVEARVILEIIVGQTANSAQGTKLQLEALGILDAILHDTARATEESLSELADRPHADELLNRLVSELNFLPSTLRWRSVEFLFRSAATLRKLNDESRASRLRSDITALFEKDEEFRRGIDLPALVSIAEHLREDEDLVEARLLLELIDKVAGNNAGDDRLRLDALSSLAAVRQKMKDLEKNADEALVRRALEDPTLAGATEDIDMIAAETTLNSTQEIGMTVEEALAALKMARLRAEQSPRDFGCQRDLSTALQRVGTEQLRKGELDHAFETFLESLRIERTLADLDPSSYDAQRHLLLALQSVGDVRARQGRHAEALKDYTEALNVGMRLEESNSVKREQKEDFERLQNDLRERINTTRLQTVAGGRL